MVFRLRRLAPPLPHRERLLSAAGYGLLHRKKRNRNRTRSWENRIISADPVLCRKLGLDAGSYVYQIVRCIKDGGKTSEMDFTYIPLSVCGGHTFDCAELSTSLIHDYISRNFPEKPTGVDIYLQPELTGDIDVSMMTGEGDGPAECRFFSGIRSSAEEKRFSQSRQPLQKLYQGMKFLTFEIPALLSFPSPPEETGSCCRQAQFRI